MSVILTRNMSLSLPAHPPGHLSPKIVCTSLAWILKLPLWGACPRSAWRPPGVKKNKPGVSGGPSAGRRWDEDALWPSPGHFGFGRSEATGGHLSRVAEGGKPALLPCSRPAATASGISSALGKAGLWGEAKHVQVVRGGPPSTRGFLCFLSPAPSRRKGWRSSWLWWTFPASRSHQRVIRQGEDGRSVE